MKTFVNEGKTATVTFPYQRNSGEMLKVGSQIGVAVDTVANGVAGVMRTEGVYSGVAKNTAGGEAWSFGARLWWDDTNKRLTVTATGNQFAGVAWAAALQADTTCTIKLAGPAVLATAA